MSNSLIKFDTKSIPFNCPSFVGQEEEFIKTALSNGHISGDGEFTAKCHNLFEKELGIAKTLLTTSCTHALEMAAILLDLKRGDEVIVPSFTFVSTVNAFVLHGATPVFADIRPDTLNIDHEQLPSLISPSTRAIVVVHYAGIACEMDAIEKLCEQHNIVLIEDNAHGLFAKYKGKYLGTIGALATQSFHETKNFSCGEGGALLINRPEFIDRAEIIREKGTNRSRFFRGQVDKYTWVDLGSSYLPSDILAAILFAQLARRTAIFNKRQHIWSRYQSELLNWCTTNGIKAPFVPEWCEQPYHMFYLLLPTLALRQAFIDHLRKKSIMAVYHYQPLNTSPMGKQFKGYEGQCPVTELISDQLVRLPLYYNLSDADQDRVIEAVLSFKC